jgi:ribosome-binding factor A
MVMKKNSNRMIRINDEIMKEISNILRSDLKDPRIGIVTSVSKVDTTNDLKYCKVYISILGDDEKRKETMDVIKKASGFIRSLVARRINLRVTPEFTFILDDSLDYSFKIDKILKDIHKTDEANAKSESESENTADEE